jgi:hypothetical protein
MIGPQKPDPALQRFLKLEPGLTLQLLLILE